MKEILNERELVGPDRKKYICPVCEKELTYIERVAENINALNVFIYVFEHRQSENQCAGHFTYSIPMRKANE